MKTITHLSQLNIKSPDRILVVMPHPDDEAVFVSGLIHRLTQSKINTRVLVMTRGEKSTLRYGLKPTDNLAKVRYQEQLQALKILGVNDFHILDFPDGGLESRSKPISNLLKKEINQFKPTHLLTLEPDGIYGHPDHIALSKIVAGFSSSSVKILFATLGPRYILPSAIHMSKKKTIVPLKPNYQLKFSLSDAWNKLKALSAHRSQLHPLKHPDAYLFFLANRLLTSEFYTYKSS